MPDCRAKPNRTFGGKGTLMYYAAADEHVGRLPGEALFHTDHVDRDPGDDHQHDRLLAQKT